MLACQPVQKTRIVFVFFLPILGAHSIFSGLLRPGMLKGSTP